MDITDKELVATDDILLLASKLTDAIDKATILGLHVELAIS